MKKRGCLVFALCAMAGALTLSCADDSGNSKPKTDKPEITIEPPALTMHVNDSNEVAIKYEAKKDLVVTPVDSKCVTVDNGPSKELTTNSEGKVSFTATAGSAQCTTQITVEDKEDSRIYKNVEVTVLPADATIPVLTLNPTSLELAAGGTASVTATVMEGVAPKSGETLTVSNGNPACITVPTTVTTDTEGKADIPVTAADAGNCIDTVTVKPSVGSTKSFQVTVLKQGDEPPAAAGTLAYDKNSVTIAPEATGSVMLSYVDGEGNGIGNVTVNFSYTNESCVKTSVNKKSPLGADGTLNITITPNGSDCNTDMTATVKGPDGDITATVAIAVTNKTKFVYDLDVQLKNEKKFDKIGYVAYAQRAESCDDLKASDLMQVVKAIMPDEDSEAGGSFPSLHKFAKIDGDTETYKSVVAFGKGSQQGEVRALNCKDVSVADDNNTVVLELEVVPTEIKGTYGIATNFDFTSAIVATDAKRVEDMKGGDWLKFLFDFFDDPAGVLLNFVWDNSVDRLQDIDDATVKKIVGALLGDGTKTVLIGVVKKLLEDYLKTFEFEMKDGTKDSYYNLIVNKISKEIISNLTRNMAFNGTIDISETGDNGVISKAKEDFTELLYPWPFEFNKYCVTDAYKPASVKCMNAMRLSSNEKLGNVTGEWNGEVADDKLTINSHSLTFKWASILAAVIVTEVLPSVFNYKDNANYKKGQYFTALIDKFGFELIVKAYEKKNAEDSTRYPALTTATGVSPCAKAIQALLYLASESVATGSWGDTITQFADQMACSQLTKLDDFVWDSLGKVESGTENLLTLESKGCDLAENDANQYATMGSPDDPVVTAHEVFGDSKKPTSRCQWDLKIGNMEKPISGLYHGARK